MEATTNLTGLALICPTAHLVPHTLSILLPQTAFFLFSTTAVIRQLGLVERLAQPGRVVGP
jgi:hypothetical protein